MAQTVATLPRSSTSEDVEIDRPPQGWPSELAHVADQLAGMVELERWESDQQPIVSNELLPGRRTQAEDDLLTFVAARQRQTRDDTAWRAAIGPALTTAGVARLLRRSEAAVAQDHDLLALTQRNGRQVYPVVQFDGDRPLPGLADVIAVLRTAVVTPWTIASWLTDTGPDQTTERPIDQLRAGNRDDVLADAQRWAAAVRR